jgi:hypothetical protein
MFRYFLCIYSRIHYGSEIIKISLPSNVVFFLKSGKIAEDAQRVVIDLKVDDRRDKDATIQSKKPSATRALEKSKPYKSECKRSIS